MTNLDTAIKVLFIHSNQPDYLAESLFHGLRTLLGKNCVDVPRYDSMYAPVTNKIRSKLRGHGFTLYGLLEEIPELTEERYFWQKDLDKYDIIIIANIWNQWGQFWELSAEFKPEKLVLLDGHDIPAFFPYASLKWRFKKLPWSYFTPVSKFKYFKRELISEGCSYGLDKFFPRSLRQRIPLPKNAKPISFSIPEEKIWQGDISEKTKDFPKHIVDLEVATHLASSSFQYAFDSEASYYDDLRKSRFGITMKRAGWDCLRHYELAANGCVLCFRDLDLKPSTCAPHGLDESNCIIYHNFKELKEKISSITTAEYYRLQQMTYQWVSLNTTVARAKHFIKACEQREFL